MAFRVGQKVVCVDPVDDLRHGEVYEVTSAGPGLKGWMIGVDKSKFHPTLPGFYARRFRPVVERKTDISVFTEMLTGSKIGVDA